MRCEGAVDNPALPRCAPTPAAADTVPVAVQALYMAGNEIGEAAAGAAVGLRDPCSCCKLAVPPCWGTHERGPGCAAGALSPPGQQLCQRAA